MSAKSPFKKCQAAGRSISVARGVNICSYSGGMLWSAAYPTTRRRTVAPADYGGRGLVLVGSALAVIVLLASLWMGWRLRVIRSGMAEENARLAALLAQNRDLSLRLARLSERDRVLRIAARHGLYPPKTGQLIRIRRKLR